MSRPDLFEPLRDPFALRDAIAAEGSMDPEYSRGAAARIFAQWTRAQACYVEELKAWAAWDGRRWVMRADAVVFVAMHNFCTGLAAMAAADDALGRGAATMARSMVSDANVSGILRIAAAHMSTPLALFDADAWLLNCNNGIIDLRTGELRAHDPAARCTKLSPVDYDAAAPIDESRFATFVREVFDGDDELAAFVQASMGYCLTGDHAIHALFFWFGSGRNGKNTLGDLLMHVMGDYARKIESRVLMRTVNDRHPTEIAQLRGVRLAIASEINKGAFWDEARIKEMSGDAVLNARGIRENPFTFNRTHKHLIYGNNKPRLGEVDAAIKTRMKLVPFVVNFEERGVADPALPERLLAEQHIALRWAVEGAVRVWAAGRRLPDAAAVREATAEYLDENDVMKEWLAEQCFVSDETKDDGAPKVVTRSRVLYRNYSDWKKGRGEGAEAESNWRQMMRNAGFKTVLRGGVTCFAGVGLLFNPEEEVGGKVVPLKREG